MTDYGPTSMKVRIESKIDATTAVSFESEFIVTTDEEAAERGTQFASLQKSWIDGYGEATQ